MKREKPPFYYLLVLIVKAIVFIVAGGVILIILLLICLSMNDPRKREIYQQVVVAQDISEVYLRNQTNTELFMTLKVPRFSLQLDTVWWGIEIAPEAVGRAVVGHYLSPERAKYPFKAPILLQGSGDTLVADRAIDLPATGQVGKRKVFYPHQNLPLWKERVRHYKPTFEPKVLIQSFSGQPDSITVVVRVASYGTFLLAHEERTKVRDVNVEDLDEEAPAGSEVYEKTTSFALLPTVRWTDSFHHSHKRRITSTDIQQARTTQPVRDSTEPNKLGYYLDCQ
ncbi:hypothetical protein [Hymenobacter psychrophilus]|uniref:Uncharacterized protein n=1 Tax=Hymenobacter psychrophilus TaxID=651662 RepID=A0A1H3J438_9BACT|nr:hypothetical protein [Hymenobacter psychrophilus]SDY34289.1 hypothetical protein SAMN04488069_107264 [Hymenobacter psychrophilus]